MVISNEIEVATLRLFEYIAISIEFYNVSRTMTVKEPAKKCAACSEGLFCLFSPYYCSLMDVSLPYPLQVRERRRLKFQTTHLSVVVAVALSFLV